MVGGPAASVPEGCSVPAVPSVRSPPSSVGAGLPVVVPSGAGSSPPVQPARSRPARASAQARASSVRAISAHLP
ncbi:MAG: hypothetical protein DCC50_04780 [Acidobacteria bacterium]|nr:MAG: hypothetical protein DCC50_04780 [Acidobacteriota bacterium]